MTSARPYSGHGLDLQARGIFRVFGERQVLRDINLNVQAGQFIAVVGRSGCGKSTLLRLIAGLDAPDRGELLAGRVPLATQRQATRMMFQESRLLPWKRVIDNVGLGLRGQWKDRAREALRAVGLEDREREWPAKLSGGQKQRVALARALVHQPRLLLLDEPLGALDALTRIEMQQLIERLWRQHGFTVILVTHDVGEAVALADRVLLIEDQHIAMDLQITVARPRLHGAAELAALEGQVLERLLGNKPSISDASPTTVQPREESQGFAAQHLSEPVANHS